MKNIEFRTDWPALLLSLLLQVPVVAWSLWLAQDGPLNFVWSLILLGPFEIVRLVVLSGLAKTYQTYLSPVQAVRSFAVQVLLPLAFFAGLFLFFGCTAFGLSSVIAVLSRPWIWVAMLVPAALIVAENALGLLFFRGDVRVQAAQLGAMAVDAKEWYGLALLFSALMMSLLLLAAIGQVPGTGAIVVVFALLSPAAYFVGKAIVLAHVHTADFKRTGRRALDVPWIQWLMSQKTPGGYPQAVQDEAQAADQRRLALRGDEIQSHPGQRW